MKIDLKQRQNRILKNAFVIMINFTALLSDPFILQNLKTWDFASKVIVRKATIDAFHVNTPRYSTEMRSFGSWTRDTLIDLGPTFIKLGQIASSRTDIFSEEFITELSILQDDCPPIENLDIPKIVESELNIGSIYSVFESFDIEPFKAASIGQVHRAVMKNGAEVVVKVRRPKIKDIVMNDLTTIESISNVLAFLKISQEGDSQLFEQCKEYLLQEIDYGREAKNAKMMRKSFSGDTDIIIPRVCSKLSNGGVLVMERVDGIKITNVSREKNKSKVIGILVKCFVTQILDHGRIHGDPHPGNLAFHQGKIVLYDFGLVLDISNIVKDSFEDIVLSIIQRDSKKLTDILLKTKLIIPNSNKANIECFFDAVFNMTRNEEMDFDFDFEESVEMLADLGYSDSNRPFTVSNDLIYLAKSCALVDGICKTLDPEYMPMQLIKPYISNKITSADIASNINFDSAMADIFEIPSKVRNMNASVLSIEKSTYSMKAKTQNLKADVRNLQIIVGAFMMYVMTMH